MDVLTAFGKACNYHFMGARSPTLRQPKKKTQLLLTESTVIRVFFFLSQGRQTTGTAHAEMHMLKSIMHIYLSLSVYCKLDNYIVLLSKPVITRTKIIMSL